MRVYYQTLCVYSAVLECLVFDLKYNPLRIQHNSSLKGIKKQNESTFN